MKGKREEAGVRERREGRRRKLFADRGGRLLGLHLGVQLRLHLVVHFTADTQTHSGQTRERNVSDATAADNSPGLTLLLREDPQHKVGLLPGFKGRGDNDVVARREAEPGAHLPQVDKAL